MTSQVAPTRPPRARRSAACSAALGRRRSPALPHERALNVARATLSARVLGGSDLWGRLIGTRPSLATTTRRGRRRLPFPQCRACYSAAAARRPPPAPHLPLVAGISVSDDAVVFKRDLLQSVDHTELCVVRRGVCNTEPPRAPVVMRMGGSSEVRGTTPSTPDCCRYVRFASTLPDEPRPRLSGA